MPDSPGGRPETTHEVFSCTPSCEPVAQRAPEITTMLHCTRRTLAQWLHYRLKKGRHLKSAVLQVDDISLLGS